jgi:DNA-directed RNA polymerase subunit E'/Rpb7
MKAKFELKSWLTENREVVIANYNKITAHQFFSGISLKDFMLKVYQLMEINNVKSEKRAASMLWSLTDRVVADNTKIEVVRDRDAEMANKYKGTAYMALV